MMRRTPESVVAFWRMCIEVYEMAVIDRIQHSVPMPEGVQASTSDSGYVEINGPKGSLNRTFQHPKVEVIASGDGLLVQVDTPRRKEKALAGTWAAHLRNMVTGVTDGFEYELKILYSHFPMTASVNGSTFVVNNYFGERVPRTADILANVKVEIKDKTKVLVSGIDKELVGQTATNIERCTRVKNRDRRVFQDGIYIVQKP